MQIVGVKPAPDCPRFGRQTLTSSPCAFNRIGTDAANPVGAKLQAMIYTLPIDIQFSGVYTARILQGNVELFDFQAPSISVAVQGGC